ncbi:MAG: agmatine deiminase family protein [Bacteroidales bacterium]|jgi:agmatine deiminase|nr:agmatine deiminase family protein [Bacteroidales bacterium]MDD3161374.1 agmatine deiminase family protein [Bacteroidales bacterium]
MKEQILLPAEWEKQSAILIAWPQKDSDWSEVYDEVVAFYSELVYAIWAIQKVIILTKKKHETQLQLFRTDYYPENVIFVECPTNDTWTRDYGAITVIKNGLPVFVDFQYNAWGLKFAADKDNQVNTWLKNSGLLKKTVKYKNYLDFVLEGGSIESDGNKTVMTTTHCLMAPNRNAGWTKEQLEMQLLRLFGAEQILWLNYGSLQGDDTDGHIDTLARFCPDNVIAYVQCEDPEDEHYQELSSMENELKSFRNIEGEPYKLVPLPMPDAIYKDGQRLPATYANFLIMNERVLCPTYNQPANDQKAIAILQSLFPTRKIKGIKSTVLITQGGSLHCSTMQFPEGVF